VKTTITLFAISVCVGCSEGVTLPPTTTNETHKPEPVLLALKPDEDEYVYELIIEQHAARAETVMSILEIEIKVTATRFNSGRVRFEFDVVRADATTGPTRERQRPDPRRAAAVRPLRWTSEHDPSGRVVDLAVHTQKDTERILDMLGARNGLFGIVYSEEPVTRGTSWRTNELGVEWQLASAADWLATLEGALAAPATDHPPKRSQSVRARVQIPTGMPIEMVGDEAITPVDGPWESVLRHWTLSLIG